MFEVCGDQSCRQRKVYTLEDFCKAHSFGRLPDIGLAALSRVKPVTPSRHHEQIFEVGKPEEDHPIRMSVHLD